MRQFIQLHFLTSYPPANLNRDDLGRPKTAKMGNVDRLRISSQSLKRHWRTSDVFAQAMIGHLGTRTKRIGVEVAKDLQAKGMSGKTAKAAAKAIAAVFGKESKERELEIKQLVHLSASERESIDALVDTLAAENREPTEDELKLLSKERMAVDIALFGRMLADKDKALYNVEAACQVAHAISVHGVVIEDDYFTAVDDLNKGDEDRGSAHIGEAGFAAALFYHYICIDRDLLIENLGGDEALANQAVQALTEAALTVAPTGKQNSFASRARASYVLAEKGSQQPRTLSVAFLHAINDDDMLGSAISKLQEQRDHFDAAYGACADARVEMDVQHGTGNLQAVLEFVGA